MVGTPFSSKWGSEDSWLVTREGPPAWLWVVARGPRQLAVCPGQVEEGREPQPCQPSAQSCAQGGREVMANLYTKCF